MLLSDHDEGPAPVPEGDFQLLASFSTPTEAHVLRGVLQAAGLQPVVSDANFAQANPWMANAIGGVRVLLPSSQLASGREAMSQWRAGDFELLEEGELPAAKPVLATLPRPIFNPDAAAFWSFCLTPVFGGLLHLWNARQIGDARLLRIARWSLPVLVLMSVAATVVALRMMSGPGVFFRGSVLLSLPNLLWYFAAASKQSRHVVQTYGRQYSRRGLFFPVLATTVGLFAAGWVLDSLR